MTNLQTLKSKREKELTEVNRKIEAQNATGWTEIKYKDKTFRLYIWENKPIGDLKVENFELADFQEAVELYDNDLLKLEVWKPVYVKHFSKKQQTKEYGLSWLCLDRGLSLGSSDGNLANSGSGGRVLLRRIK